MDLDDSSPLVPLATKLFTSPGQLAGDVVSFTPGGR
jgi:hypothetical protein